MTPQVIEGFENLINCFISATEKDISYYTNKGGNGLNLYNDVMSFLKDPINDSYKERMWFEQLDALDKETFNKFVSTLKPGDESNKDIIKQGSSISYLIDGSINIDSFNLCREDAKLLEGHTENLVCSCIAGQYIKFKIVDTHIKERTRLVCKNLYHIDRFLLKSHNKEKATVPNKLLESIATGKRFIRHNLRTTTIVPRKMVMSDYVYEGGIPTKYQILGLEGDSATIGKVTDAGGTVSDFKQVPINTLRHSLVTGLDKDGYKLSIGNLVRIPNSQTEEVLEFLGYKKPASTDPPLAYAAAEWGAYRIIFFTTSFRVLDLFGDIVYITPEEHPDHPTLMEKAHLKGLIFCLNKKNIEFDHIRAGTQPISKPAIVTDPQEDILGKKKREAQERMRLEKEFDKTKGPYNLQNYVGKLVKIDSFGVDIFEDLHGKNGCVKSVDDEIGRVVIEFEKNDFYFRESQGETKHIIVLSSLVVSSEENPELV